ncbi:MAG: sensor histidine kinase [Campylobacterota bacterium]
MKNSVFFVFVLLYAATMAGTVGYLIINYQSQIKQVQVEFADRRSVRYINKSYAYIQQSYSSYLLFLQNGQSKMRYQALDSLDMASGFFALSAGTERACMRKTKKGIETLANLLDQKGAKAASPSTLEQFGSLVHNAKKCMMDTEVDIWKKVLRVFEASAQRMDQNNKILFALIGLLIVTLVFVAYLYQQRLRAQKKIQDLNTSLEDKVKDQTQKLRKQLQQLQYKDQMLQEQAKLAAMGEMMSAIAHQWRQPLNALAISIQNLDDDYAEGLIDEAFVENFIDKQMDMIAFMSKTIDDFRDFFKTDKTKTTFSIEKVLNDVYSLLQAQLKNHNIELIISGEDFSVEGCSGQMQQVFLNLISNSKDAIIAHAKSGTITAVLDDKEKKISFCDSGGGVSQEVLQKIFDPYFTTKGPDKGTGIGLYISRTIIVSNMGGQMSAHNTKEGLCIELDLKAGQK